MKRSVIFALCLTGSTLISAGQDLMQDLIERAPGSGAAASRSTTVASVVSANRFAEPIVGRNAFGLKPIPVPVAPEPQPPPLLNVKLLGTASVSGIQKAVVNITDPLKPPNATNTTIYVLAVGQREKEVEIVSIDIAAQTVKIKNREKDDELHFDKESTKAGPPTQLVMMPGGQPIPFRPPPINMPGMGIPVPNPNGMPGAIANPNPNFSISPMPLPAPVQMQPIINAADGSGSIPMPMQNASGTLPTRPLRTEVQMTPEQNALLIEAQRQAAAQRGAPPPPSLPGFGNN